jgi:cysteine-rich repeat protein
MKKLLFSLLFISGAVTSLGAHAAFSSVSCSGLAGASGCGACFQQTSPIYTCNPHQASCSKEMINSMSDTATNIAGWGKFMRQAYPGTIAMARVQNTTSWSAQNASSEMFELTPQFYSPAPAVGQKWYQLATSGYYGHYLPVGTSVKWTQLKSNGWIRPDIAQPGTSRTSPAYKVTFTPRLYINATEFIDHSQCVFFYVRFCGDGIKDSDRGEQCDDGNMNSGDGCSNICQPETTVNPVCNNLTVSPTSVINGGNITYTCTGTNVTSYSITARDANNNIVGSSTSAAGGLILPANPLGTYTISCFVNGQITTPSSCQKTVTNTTNPTPQIDIDKRDANNADLDGSIGNDTQTVTSGTAAVFKIRVTNNGTEDLRNIVPLWRSRTELCRKCHTPLEFPKYME